MAKKSRYRIVHVGTGPIGVQVIDQIMRRPDLKLVGVVDTDPERCTQAVGDPPIRIQQDLSEVLSETAPDVVTLTTSSRFPTILDDLRRVISHQASVISTTEELAFPWLNYAEQADQLSGAAKRFGARILGTGVNPGFVLDVLPLLLTTACLNVRKIHGERVVDAAQRRGPLQRKIGAGLPLDQFEQRVQAKQVGHVGLLESAALVAYRMGWPIDEITETIEPVVAERPVATEHVQVPRGHAAGVNQCAVIRSKGQEVIRLVLQMYIGAVHPHDTIRLDSDPPLEMSMPRGLEGDQATVARVINSIEPLLRLGPGLWTVADLPIR